ncbi:MAG: hypothetical protein ACTHYV_03925 [Psychroflexus sp.]
MKKIIPSILVLCLLISCTTKESKIDEDFKNCQITQLNKKLEIIKPPASIAKSIKKIPKKLEQFLLKENYIKNQSKEEYQNLFKKIKSGKINSKLIKKFDNKIGFSSSAYFDTNPSYCLRLLINEKNIPNKNDWHYKFLDSYYKFQANSGMGENLSLNLIKKTIDKIPNKEFNKLIYRQIILNEIYLSIK